MSVGTVSSCLRSCNEAAREGMCNGFEKWELMDGREANASCSCVDINVFGKISLNRQFKLRLRNCWYMMPQWRLNLEAKDWKIKEKRVVKARKKN